jgi:transposase
MRTPTPPPVVAAPRPRLRQPDRTRVAPRALSLEQMLPDDHPARVVWDFVGGLDLTPLYRLIRAVEGQPGRDANDPRILLALWLYATLRGVGSARELDRLCREHVAYQWLCGGVPMNYHALADFRGSHPAFLDDLLTHSVATLLHEGLIDLQRVTQDGVRLRAAAGAASFRRRPSLQRCLAEAQRQLAALQPQAGDDPAAVSRRQQAARQRAARERQQRVQAALHELDQLQAHKEAQRRTKGVRFQPEELRASTTDPEARRMQLADGGYRPGYNAQLATTTRGGVIVGVDVTNAGGDGGQLAPMIDQLVRRHGVAPAAAVVDGGFTTLDDIEAVHGRHGTQVYGPVKDAAKKQAAGQDPYRPRPKDKPGVAAWRERMGTEAARAVLRQRGATAEWVNAGLRNRGVYQVRVRGRAKVWCVLVWQAVAHNLLRGVALRAAAAAGVGAVPG